MCALPCDTRKHNRHQTSRLTTCSEQYRTNRRIGSTSNPFRFDTKTCDIRTKGSYISKGNFIYSFLTTKMLFFCILSIFLTWKQRSNRDTINLSLNGAWIFSRQRSYSVRPKKSIQPKMWLHMFTVSFVHQNMLQNAMFPWKSACCCPRQNIMSIIFEARLLPVYELRNIKLNLSRHSLVLKQPR